jgi:hypothetical protein
VKIKYWLAGLLLPVLLITACGGGSETTAGAESSDTPAATTEEASGSDKTAEALAAYDLPETAVVDFGKPDIGTLTLGYPGGWLFFNDFFITPSEDVNAIDLQTGMPPGATFIQINGHRAGAFGSEDAASFSEGAFGSLADNEGITFSSLEAVPIAGEGIAAVSKQTASKSDIYDTAFYILETEGGEYITLMFYTAPGELDSQQSLMDAVVASVSYTAP